MTIGERIRARRLLRGWSIRHAAGRAGVSHATWSRIERGLQAADNRFVLAGIAAALECSPADLAGEPVPAADRAAAAAHAAVPGIRQALVDIAPAEDPAGNGPPSGHRTLNLVESLRQACDYAGAARLLPGLLRDPHAAKAPRLLCEATFAASSLLRNLGHPAEAWLGAERCRDAADAAGDPRLRAYAGYALAAAANACGAYRRGLAIAERAAHDHPAGPEMLGSLYLICSQSARGLGRADDSRAWSGEAAALARRTGETTTMGMYFGPTNVGIWRIGTEDDPGLAVGIARQTNPAVIPAGFRQVFFYADTARALSHIGGHDREAIRFLLTAERVAPQHVHASPAARETTRSLLERSRGTEIRGLAERMRIS
jgi:transcriptional regulator with XRE-family HTH domain